MKKKFKLTNETRTLFTLTLHRIEAVKDFNLIKAGTKGGWVEKESNLSHLGCAWIDDDAIVFDNAIVSGDANIRQNASIYGNAKISGSAQVSGNAVILGNAKISGNAQVSGNATVLENAKLLKTEDIMHIDFSGNRLDSFTFFRTGKGVSVCSEWLVCTLEDFENKVETLNKNDEMTRKYKTLIKLAKIHFGLEE